VTFEYGVPTVEIFAGVFHTRVPTPDTSATDDGFDGPLISANAGEIIPNRRNQTREIDKSFREFHKEQIFIEVR
jgi:hypothetical protein